LIQHVVQQCNLSLLVTNDGEFEVAAADLVDILDPVTMAVDCVCGETDQLDPSSCKFWLELCESAQLGRADWGEIFGVGKQNDPIVANELMEIDLALSRLGLKVRGDAAQAKAALLSMSIAAQRSSKRAYGSGRSTEPIVYDVNYREECLTVVRGW
jgi:hypothetical protein